VVLGVDSLDLELTKTWARAGDMPTFAKLLQTTFRGAVDNPLGLEAGSVWPTFTTGAMPDEHGQFDGPYKFDTETYEVRLLSPAERAGEPFWVAASKAGRRVAVVDVPYALLEDEINGVQIVDWLTHVRTQPAGFASRPAGAAPQIAAKYGVNPFAGPNRCPTNDVAVDTAGAIVAFRDQLVDRVARKEALCREVLAQEPWDFFIAVFHDAHDVGHMCWHVHDATHERHDPAIAARVGDPLRAVYAAIDASIGRLLNVIDDYATVIVYSSHGMGPERTATRFLDDLLLKIEESYEDPTAPPAPRSWGDRIAPLYRALVPRPIRRQLLKTTPIAWAYRHRHTEELKRRRFFELAANHATGGVRFNLRGRERCGRVAPGREFERLSDRLAEDLLRIVNLGTGQPLIESVVKTSDLYPGPMRASLPDLLLEWNKSGPIEQVASPKIGTLVCHYRRVRSGDHVRKRGAFLALGPGIVAGHSSATVRAVDFAPTFAALLGLAKAGYAGAAIPGIVSESSPR
jgi:predicted AlkP superfamily phosphohydrolase/phosphomutase